MKPFAFEILEHFLDGRSIASLARETGIRRERLETRIRVAARLSCSPWTPEGLRPERRDAASETKPGAVDRTAPGHAK